MVKRDELIDFINETIGLELLEKVQSFDISANGVQVHGASEVKKIALGVSANIAYFEKVVKSGAQFSLTHHGLNLSEKYTYNARLDPSAQKRLRFVFENNLTVVAYHAA